MNTDSIRLATTRFRPVSKLLTLVLAFSFSVVSFSASVEPAPSAMSQLVQMLVEQKTLTPEQGELLLQAAAAERAAQAAPAPAATTAEAEKVPGRMNVRYVPESVKAQLREEIKQDVMAQAREENWAAPRSLPEWTTRFRPFGDVRLRFETVGFPGDNDPTAQVDFNAINHGSPFDANLGNGYPPLYNTDADRNRLRLRARLGAEIDLGENFYVGTRIATGSDNSPVSTNQSLGSDGLGAKYAIWLDRTFLRYETPGLEGRELTFTAGRFDNPFFSTDLIWDDDLGFDGLAATYRHTAGRIRPFLTAGAFPVYNTSFNLSSNQPNKFKSDDKWLLGAQFGADIDLGKKLSLKLGAAYYDFVDIEGRFSSPITDSTLPGDTDSSRPAFAQKGNTYMKLRNNQYLPTDPAFDTRDYQYYGLATLFRELALTAKLDIKHFHPFHVSLDAEFVKNLAYDEGRINRYGAQNNLKPLPSNDVDGGDIGWLLRLNLGDPVLEKRWDWQVNVGYKYLETDAVVDGFTDSDFGLGGTNLEGYFIGGSLALSKHVWTRLRWMSADNVSGSPYSVDVFQFDLNARF
ncbi:putative porin [Geminisphaera colitermitum]|uniref:putative porin n=1 Tax=Geminisphaera colitermitum TaxID=1148786 RepID=UPI000158D22A|nr:putative porin [Geminisphaera colitermitum]